MPIIMSFQVCLESTHDAFIGNLLSLCTGISAPRSRVAHVVMWYVRAFARRGGESK